MTQQAIADIIAAETGLKTVHVEAALNLLAEGATIPFVSRYRKEATGGMNEVEIFNISSRAGELEELMKRKTYILNTIESQGNLTDELRSRIEACNDINVLEDIYLPLSPNAAPVLRLHARTALNRWQKSSWPRTAPTLKKLRQGS